MRKALNRYRAVVLAAATAAVTAAALTIVAPGGTDASGASDPAHQLTKIQRRLLSGYSALELEVGATPSAKQPARTDYFPRGSDQCPENIKSNIKVNQNCLNLTDPDLQGRGQAENETAIAQDPRNPQHMIAGSNDYRRGDGQCFPSYSLDSGRTWNDTALPTNFTRGEAFGAQREYWQTCGDPFVLGYDTHGNAYFGGLMFNRGRPASSNSDLSSAVYVYRSTLNNGASWNFPGRPVVESPDVAGTGAVPFEDKPYGTIDNHGGSPFANRLYVTWTEFAPDGTAYIWEKYSADYGETFSARHLVSANSPYCTNTYSLPTPHGNCNQNQFSQPFTGPDGSLYVVMDNYNNTPRAGDNRNQILMAKSTDGGETFSTVQKVADYYDLPDCATYQDGKDLGRACVPEKGPTSNSFFRATNYPSGSVDPTDPNRVAVTFGSYINRHSNESNGCVPAGTSPVTGQNLFTGVKTPGACNNDILLSVSNDGGATFTGTTTDPRELTSVTTESGQATTDQFWQWIAYTRTGLLATSYYDRQYGDDETTGYSDVSLSGSGSLSRFVVQRVTSSSMPPPTQFEGLFLGDYSGLSAVTDAYPLWTDTRNHELFLCPGTGTTETPPGVCGATAPNAPYANDQDMYTAAVAVPAP